MKYSEASWPEGEGYQSATIVPPVTMSTDHRLIFLSPSVFTVLDAEQEKVLVYELEGTNFVLRGTVELEA